MEKRMASGLESMDDHVRDAIHPFVANKEEGAALVRRRNGLIGLALPERLLPFLWPSHGRISTNPAQQKNGRAC
jgi:hypothetical protein